MVEFRIDGILLCYFLAYAVIFISDSRLMDGPVRHLPYGVHIFSDLYTNIRNLFVGLTFLVLSSVFKVFFGSSLAQYVSLDLLYFSTIFLGLITTLPELLFGVRSALLSHPTFAVGNLLASVAFNSTLTPGMLSIFSPIRATISMDVLSFNAGLTFVAFFFLSIFAYSGSRISRNEGTINYCTYYFCFIFLLYDNLIYINWYYVEFIITFNLTSFGVKDW